MAPNSLSPASMVLDYHSTYGAHKMTVPTKEWFPTNLTGTLGSYEAWDLSTVDAEGMAIELASFLAKFLPSSGAFDSVTIYTQASPTSPNIPQRTASLGIAGTDTNTNQSQAVSATWNMKTTNNGGVKIVLLDTALLSTWLNKILPADWTVDQANVFGTLSAPTNAFAGRDDFRVSAERSITYDINDKLQRQYFR